MLFIQFSTSGELKTDWLFGFYIVFGFRTIKNWFFPIPMLCLLVMVGRLLTKNDTKNFMQVSIPFYLENCLIYFTCCTVFLAAISILASVPCFSKHFQQNCCIMCFHIYLFPLTQSLVSFIQLRAKAISIFKSVISDVYYFSLPLPAGMMIF